MRVITRAPNRGVWGAIRGGELNVATPPVAHGASQVLQSPQCLQQQLDSPVVFLVVCAAWLEALLTCATVAAV